MIDRQQRDSLAQGLTRLLADQQEGQGPAVVNVDEVLELEPRPSPDRAARDVWEFTFELFWPDVESGREPQLQPEYAELIGRCVRFLRTDLEYAWRLPEERRGGCLDLALFPLLVGSFLGVAQPQRVAAWLYYLCVAVLFASLARTCWLVCVGDRGARETARWWDRVQAFWPFPDEPAWVAAKANPP